MIDWNTKVKCNYCSWEGAISSLSCVTVPGFDGDVLKEIGCPNCKSHLFLQEVKNVETNQLARTNPTS